MSLSQKRIAPSEGTNPPLPHCTHPSCYGCPLWIWEPPRKGHPGSTVCGFCGDTGRTTSPSPVTSELASAAKRRCKLQLAGAETAEERAAAESVLRRIGEALVVSIEAGRKSLDRSCEKLHLPGFAVRESPGSICCCGLAEGTQHDPRCCSGSEDIYNTEIAAKTNEIKKMSRTLEEIRKMGLL